MAEETGKDPVETPEESEEKPKEQPTEVQPQEPETEPVEPEKATPEQAMDLAKNLQKGYTMTRQEMAEIRQNQEAIQESLTKLSAKKDEYSGAEEEPLTVSKLLELQRQQKATATKEEARVNRDIDSQLSDLRIQGAINTKEDEDKLMDYAVKHKITDLSQAANIMADIVKARKEGQKTAAKSKVKSEAGSQIGTSRSQSSEKGGIPYEDIANKDINEILEEGQ